MTHLYFQVEDERSPLCGLAKLIERKFSRLTLADFTDCISVSLDLIRHAAGITSGIKRCKWLQSKQIGNIMCSVTKVHFMFLLCVCFRHDMTVWDLHTVTLCMLPL